MRYMEQTNQPTKVSSASFFLLRAHRVNEDYPMKNLPLTGLLTQKRTKIYRVWRASDEPEHKYVIFFEMCPLLIHSFIHSFMATSFIFCFHFVVSFVVGATTLSSLWHFFPFLAHSRCVAYAFKCLIMPARCIDCILSFGKFSNFIMINGKILWNIPLLGGVREQAMRMGGQRWPNKHCWPNIRWISIYINEMVDFKG